MREVEANGDVVQLPADASLASRAAKLTRQVQALRLPEKAGAVPTGTWLARLPWVLCAVLTCSTAALAIGAFNRPAASAVPGPAAQPMAAPGIAMQAAAVGEVVLESKGYLIPVHQIQVSPKVSGMVVELRFEEGKQVEKDEILAKLETVDYEADRNRARGVAAGSWQRFLELYTGNRPDEIRQAKAELDEAVAEKERWYPEYQRTIGLNRAGAVAQRDYEEAISKFRGADRRVERLRLAYGLMLEGARTERLEAAWAEVMQTEADLTKAQWRLDNCVIRAPIKGTILTKKAEEGNIVNSVAFNVAASLCDMADLSDLEVDLNIQERDIANVFKGQRCRIRPEAFPQREYEGHVSRLMPIADRAKGALPVRVKVKVPQAEEGMFLRPEMSVLVSFFKK